MRNRWFWICLSGIATATIDDLYVQLPGAPNSLVRLTDGAEMAKVILGGDDRGRRLTKSLKQRTLAKAKHGEEAGAGNANQANIQQANVELAGVAEMVEMKRRPAAKSRHSQSGAFFAPIYKLISATPLVVPEPPLPPLSEPEKESASTKDVAASEGGLKEVATTSKEGWKDAMREMYGIKDDTAMFVLDRPVYISENHDGPLVIIQQTRTGQTEWFDEDVEDPELSSPDMPSTTTSTSTTLPQVESNSSPFADYVPFALIDKDGRIAILDRTAQVLSDRTQRDSAPSRTATTQTTTPAPATTSSSRSPVIIRIPQAGGEYKEWNPATLLLGRNGAALNGMSAEETQ